MRRTIIAAFLSAILASGVSLYVGSARGQISGIVITPTNDEMLARSGNPAPQQLKSSGLVLYNLQGINIKTTGATTIFTTDEGGRFHPLFVVVELTAASSLTVGATVSIGTNSATFNNVMVASVTGTTINKMLPNALSALTDSIAPNTDVKLNLSIAATGTSGTLSVTVVGFYQ